MFLAQFLQKAMAYTWQKHCILLIYGFIINKLNSLLDFTFEWKITNFFDIYNNMSKWNIKFDLLSIINLFLTTGFNFMLLLHADKIKSVVTCLFSSKNKVLYYRMISVVTVQILKNKCRRNFCRVSSFYYYVTSFFFLSLIFFLLVYTSFLKRKLL